MKQPFEKVVAQHGATVLRVYGPGAWPGWVACA
jgi:hypothetical protein